MRHALVLLVLVGSLFLHLTARAQWQFDGTALSTAASAQLYPTIASDGSGGAIVTWYDYRSGTSYDIYAQRVNASGTPQWTADGVALCTAALGQSTPTIVSDGAGGAIVTWDDSRSGTGSDIYAQRVNALGVPQWTPDGVALCTAASGQSCPTIVSDGAGGAIVTWYDFRSGNYDIYAQRVNASGTPQWTANGVVLCTAAFDQSCPTIVSDGAGGAIVTWDDSRSGTATDIYAQRVNTSGVPQWTPDGVALCTAANYQSLPTIDSDGAGGAIVTWQDFRSGTTSDIFAQRVNTSGVPQWTPDGVALCFAANEQSNPTIVSDDAGGAIVSWDDYRSGAKYDIYAQRVNASGAPQWTINGVALCTVANSQPSPKIVSDGAGGAIVTWRDFRSGAYYDIYAQRVNVSGTPQWTANGVALSTAANSQSYPTIVSDGTGGVIVTWFDSRSGAPDIYAQRVEARYGEWGRPEPVILSAMDNPSDQGGKVALNWNASGRDQLNQALISHYSLWRAVTFVPVSAAVDAAAPEPSGFRVESPADVSREFSGHAYYIERTLSGTYYWEWVANQSARYTVGYSYLVPTRQDSVAGNPAVHYFQVLAHTANAYTFWESNIVNGYSIDNLAPAAPFLLTAQRVGADVNLKWNRAVAPDLRDYSVYRGTSTGVTPVPINFLSLSDDTLLVDVSAPANALYYIVTACDVHSNQSAPSNEASVSATTGVGNTPSITALTILGNMPNPFNETTTLRIGLPKAGEVEIDVFDVAGRRVRSERVASLAAGWREISFQARDASGQTLPSGVYFYRVTANGETITRKMVITR